jgi:uncharacterized protein YbjT (DUF2867 family)
VADDRNIPSFDVLVTGGTGYIGVRLAEALVKRGHRVRVLARGESAGRVVAGATAVIGGVLDEGSVARALRLGDTVVHLVGTPHPNPSKAEEFRRVDLASIRAVAAAGKAVGIAHLVFVSVAQPAPVMRAYIAARAEGEEAIRSAGLTATVLRPWYVLGPGHWWPVLLQPLYWLAALVPVWRDGARRLGLVTLGQMVAALVHAVEHPPQHGAVRIVDVPGIRGAARAVTR